MLLFTLVCLMVVINNYYKNRSTFYVLVFVFYPSMCESVRVVKGAGQQPKAAEYPGLTVVKHALECIRTLVSFEVTPTMYLLGLRLLGFTRC